MKIEAVAPVVDGLSYDELCAFTGRKCVIAAYETDDERFRAELGMLPAADGETVHTIWHVGSTVFGGWVWGTISYGRPVVQLDGFGDGGILSLASIRLLVEE